MSDNDAQARFLRIAALATAAAIVAVSVLAGVALGWLWAAVL